MDFNRIEEITKYKILNQENYDLNSTNMYQIGYCLTSTYIIKFITNELLKYNDYNIDLNAILNKILEDDINESLLYTGLKEYFNNKQFLTFLGYVYKESNEDEFIKVINNVLNIETTIINELKIDDNYIPKIIDWEDKKYKKTANFIFDFEENNDILLKSNSKGKVKCKLLLDGFDKCFIGYGDSTLIAKMDVSKLAYNYLKEQHMLVTMKDEVGDADELNCVFQLQTLFTKGFINEPQVKFIQKTGKKGEDIWKARITVDGFRETFTSEDSSKKTAKRNVCYDMLKFLIEYDSKKNYGKN